jgi:hypothetical protein
VRRYALEEAERCGTNYLVSWFAFGDLGVDHVIRSVELFSEHVMSAFTQWYFAATTLMRFLAAAPRAAFVTGMAGVDVNRTFAWTLQ